jgi:FixJ family two-component response regulator
MSSVRLIVGEPSGATLYGTLPPTFREMMMVERPKPQSVVYVIDDDDAVRETLSGLLRSVGLQVKTFATPLEFLASQLADVPSCLEFQTELAKANILVPIIFITGHGDIPMSVKAMKAGAIEFLTKPFRDQDLLDAVQAGLDRDRARWDRAAADSELRGRFERLTAREQEAMALVTSGLMNKQIAAEMDLSEVTVKVHRGNVMRKMGAKSLAELVRMADALGLRNTKS